MKTKRQKRYEALERIKRALPAAEAEAAKVQRLVNEENAAERRKESTLYWRDSLFRRVYRMKAEIAHLESL